MPKSSEAEQARRVNLTLSLLRQQTSTTEVLEKLVARYGLSRRQAYRYVTQARGAVSPLPVPEAKAVFTVKLPGSFIKQVRRLARQQGQPISLWVERALQVALDQANEHG